MVLGNRYDLRSADLGSFSASMLKTIAESPVDPAALGFAGWLPIPPPGEPASAGGWHG